MIMNSSLIISRMHWAQCRLKLDFINMVAMVYATKPKDCVEKKGFD